MTAASTLLVGARGNGERPGGLYRLPSRGGEAQHIGGGGVVSAILAHPRLPLVYALAGAESEPGRLLVWRGDGEESVAFATGGVEPCSLDVSPDGRCLVVANYSSHAVALFTLGADGMPVDAPQVTTLTGSGPDPGRQEAAHPHHVQFTGADTVRVVDLGADRVRTLARIDGLPALVETAAEAVPVGCGPRHPTELAAGSLAISGELDSTVIWRTTSSGPWRSIASTGIRAEVRNYPSDIVAAPRHGLVYVGNRGNGTIGVIDTISETLVQEIRVPGTWPQHLLLTTGALHVAVTDADAVVAFTVHADGSLGEHPELIARVPRPSWLLLNTLLPVA
ncbi:lactonase family protein [Microbacterium lacticum]